MQCRQTKGTSKQHDKILNQNISKIMKVIKHFLGVLMAERMTKNNFK